MIGWVDIIRADFLELLVRSRDVVTVWIYCYRPISSQREERCAMTLEFPFSA